MPIDAPAVTKLRRRFRGALVRRGEEGKAIHDPDNFFRLNDNIPPERSGTTR